ncbi:MAG TPA: hypothetical protein VKV20_19630 [Ktedonobacteraceae bacterium]|jgi:hypothetical protein|nr:hypothetical protein [Ktedonobacteraceae bacterium]
MADNQHRKSAEGAQGLIRSYVTEIYPQPLSAKNIQALSVDTVFAGKCHIEVGQHLDPRIAHTLQERVLAIFANRAQDQFLVCTSHRGAWQDMPYIFGKREVTDVQEASHVKKSPQVLSPTSADC